MITRVKREAFTKYSLRYEYNKYAINIKLLTQKCISTSEIMSNGSECSVIFDVCLQHSEAGRHSNTVISFILDLLDLFIM